MVTMKKSYTGQRGTTMSISAMGAHKTSEKPITKREIQHYASILRDMSLTDTQYEDILTPLAHDRLKFEATYRRLQRQILKCDD